MSSALKLPFRTGGLLLSSNHFLSPLEGVSCVGFRALCHKNGAALTFTEMIRAQAINRNNSATLDLIDTYDENTPTGIQLLAKSASELKTALLRLSSLSNDPQWYHFKNICAIDLNLGCPSPDVIREGAGPSLLKRKKVLSEMFEVMVEFKSMKENLGVKAVGCKIRLGLNSLEESHKVYLRVVEAANDAGLDWITVHARNARMRSSDQPHWDAIREVVDTVDGLSTTQNNTRNKILVIGNGDVKCLSSRSELYDASRCDGFMVARAAIRNPWIFNDFNKTDNSINKVSESSWPTLEQVDHATNEYSNMAIKYKTKSKFVSYHEKNFARLRKSVETGNAIWLFSRQIRFILRRYLFVFIGLCCCRVNVC